MSRARPFLCLLALLGCARVQLGEPRVVSEVTIAKRTEEERREGPLVAKVDQEGAEIAVSAARSCLADVIEVQTVESVSVRARRSANSWADLSRFASGLAFGAGGAALITAEALANGSPTTSSRQEQTNDAFIGVGIGLAALGAALLTISIVDSFRTSGSQNETSRDLRRTTLEKDVDCGTSPVAGAPVAAQLGGDLVQLGLTGPQGTLHASLADSIPEHSLPVSSPDEPRLSITVDGKFVSDVRTEPLGRRHEDEAWRNANGEACRAERSAAACRGVTEFLERYPRGRHADEARRALRGLPPQ